MIKRFTLLVLILLTCAACNKKSKDELYAEAVKQLNASNPNGAIVLLKSALEKDENFYEARYQLAKAYAAAGKREQAEKEFTKVLKLNPSRDEVLLDLAGVMNSSRKPDEAIRLAEQYLSKHPGATAALEVQGIAHAIANRYADAEAILLQALKAEPTNPKVKTELAAVYMAAGKLAQSRATLQELLATDTSNIRAYHMLADLEKRAGNPEKALEAYQRIQTIKPGDTLAQYKSGLIYIEKGDLPAADKIAEELVTKSPKSADGHRLKGLIAYYRKNYPEAMNALQTSLKIAPTLEAYHFLGLCHYNRGELESALSQFRKIIDYVPDSRQAQLMTATILLAQKRTDDAIEQIKKLIQLNEKDAAAHNLLGSAYMSKGMFDEGMRELNRATQLDPRIVDAHLKKGYFYFSRGNNAAGETELATAVQAAPDALNARLIQASYYMRTNNSSKAMAILKAGLTGKKSDAPLYNSIAAVQFAENKPAEAVKSIQQAKSVDPTLATSYNTLATYYAATGKFDTAIAEYTELLKHAPQNHQAMLGLAALYELKENDKEALNWYTRAKETRMPGVYMALARFHMKKKDTGKAIKVLDEALKNDARDISALEAKGRILLSDKKYKDALKTFEEITPINQEKAIDLKIATYITMKEASKALEQGRIVVARYPSSARGYMVMASIYESQKDISNAISELNKGLRVEPNNVQAMLYLGNLLETRKEYDQALNIYSDAYRKNGDFIPALFAQAALLDHTGKKQDAIIKYRAVLDKNPGYVPALNNLAYLYADGHGNKDEALRLAITAYRQEPGNAGVMDTLGYSLIKVSRYDDARKVLEKSVSLLPNNPTVSYHMALAYKLSGDKANALKTVQKALSMGDFPDAAAARTLLTELR